MIWQDYLASGERLLWEGRPRKGVRVWPAAVFSILGVPFLVGGIFALREGRGLGAPVFDLALTAMGLVFVGLGGHLVAGVWIVEASRHWRIRYALTDRAGYIRQGTISGCPTRRTVRPGAPGSRTSLTPRASQN